MARGNTYTCACCGKTYNYCAKCGLVEPDYNAERFCCGEHQAIFEILSKNGCGLASAQETLHALSKFNMPGEFAPGIKEHIAALKAEIKPAKVISKDAE